MWTSWRCGRDPGGRDRRDPQLRAGAPFVRGVINLRGAVLPIVDLAARLGFEGSDTSERSVIIVAQAIRN